MRTVNRILLACMAVVSVSALWPAPTTASASVSDAVFIDAEGVHAADFTWSGECNGEVTITLTIHRAGGDDVRTSSVAGTMVPDACFTHSCFECPPVPIPFAWELKGPGVFLAGGGSSYYYTYQNWEAAWSLQGTFDEGRLEARGTLL